MRATLRVEITRRELIALAISKAEERGIQIAHVDKHRVKPVFDEYDRCQEGQQEALRDGSSVSWVEITIYPGKTD
jgi:hypothetical protein